MKYFDDIQIGDVLMTGRHVFAADEIKSFATRFDPQLFHVDDDAAVRSHFGALCASGWHTACVGCGCSSIIGVPRTRRRAAVASR